MTFRNTFPAPAGVALSVLDTSRNLTGLVAQNASGAPRAGVFADSDAALGSAVAGAMSVSVAAFSGALVDNGTVLYGYNDGAVTVALGSPPSSNSRYHIVYAKQNMTASPWSDPDNNAVFGVTVGATSASPDRAAAIAAVPAGALPLVAVLIPSTATTSESSGVTITNAWPFTVAAGGVLPVRNATERAAWTPADGALCNQLDTAMVFQRKAGEWVPTAPLRGTTSQRDAAWGPTSNAAQRVALAGKGAQWFNTDKGYEERYYSANGDAGADPKLSAATAGWWPVAGGIFALFTTNSTAAYGGEPYLGNPSPSIPYTEVSDIWGLHSASVDPAEIKPNVAGHYRVSVNAVWGVTPSDGFLCVHHPAAGSRASGVGGGHPLGSGIVSGGIILPFNGTSDIFRVSAYNGGGTGLLTAMVQVEYFRPL